MILVCAATDFELAAFPATLDLAARRFVTGVGIPATFAGLTAAVSTVEPTQRESMTILNIGIAGAYPDCGIAIGDVVIGTGEVYGDIGFECGDTDGGFQAIADTPFGGFYEAGYALNSALTLRMHAQTHEPLEVRITPAAYQVHKSRGCTVNTCTGTRATGLRRRDRFDVQFESMEGAAVAQIGQSAGVPVSEIRAISNFASDRDMRPENIRLAIENLRSFLETSYAA